MRIGAVVAYGIVILAFAASAYAMHDSIRSANDTFDDVARILREAEGLPVDPPRKPNPAAPQRPVVVTPPSLEVPVPARCFVGGCSGQICSDSPDAISTCEWREQYACFATASCERQDDGRCGWTMDEELTSCLAGR